MSWFLLKVLWLLLPIVGGGVFQVLVLRYRVLTGLAVPVDRGLAIGGRRLFGDHKTVRGFLVMMVGAASWLWLQALCARQYPAIRELGFVDYRDISPWWDGMIYGAGYVLGELPNSFAKRRLGIGDGQKGTGGLGLFFLVLDQVDGIFGILISMCVFYVPAWQVAVTAFFMLTVIHVVVFNVLLWWLGVKKRIF